MIELYQAEWCPHSSRVRQRLTELGVSFVARQVPAERADREELRRKTGSEEIPTILLEALECLAHDMAIYAEDVAEPPLAGERFARRVPSADDLAKQLPKDLVRQRSGLHRAEHRRPPPYHALVQPADQWASWTAGRHSPARRVDVSVA